MRALLLIPLLACLFVVGAAGEDPRSEIAAIRKLGTDDSSDAAKRLFDIWNRSAGETQRLRIALVKLRVRHDELAGKLRKQKDPRKRSSLTARIRELDGETTRLDRQLSRLELRRAAVLDAIDSMKSAEVAQWMASTGLRRAKDPVLRRSAAMNIVRSPGTSDEAIFAALGKARKPDTIVPLLQALARRTKGSDSAVPIVAAHLKNKDWAVRVAAGQALAAVARPACVEPLIGALTAAANRSREQRELAAALTRLTGQKHGPYPDVWAKWWKDEHLNVKAGRVPLGKGARGAVGKGDQGSFYGIPQTAERIIYVVDISGSMEVSMANPQWIDGESVPARDDEDSRFDAGMRELIRATRKLRPRSTFAVIVYSSQVRALHDEMTPATKENRSKLEQDVAHLGPEGSTNIYAAMEAALRLAGVYTLGITGRPKQVADAIYLLSDGSPTDAKGKREDPERTLVAIKEWNALRRIAIHTIGIGRDHNRAFLERLATENGGQYYAVKAKK